MVFLLEIFLISEAYIFTEFYPLKHSFIGGGEEGDKCLNKQTQYIAIPER